MVFTQRVMTTGTICKRDLPRNVYPNCGHSTTYVYNYGSCPFDFIKVYDGGTNEANVIDTYCGQMEDVTIFSTKENLTIEFVTKSGRAEATKKTYFTYDETKEPELQRRGFNASFDISNDFVDLGESAAPRFDEQLKAIIAWRPNAATYDDESHWRSSDSVSSLVLYRYASREHAVALLWDLLGRIFVN